MPEIGRKLLASRAFRFLRRFMSFSSPYKYTVFIAYRWEDGAAEANLIWHALEKKVQRERIFLDTKSLQGGQHNMQTLRAALGGSQYMVLLVTPMSFRVRKKRDRYLEGIEFALDNKMTVIPVIFPGCGILQDEPLPEPLRRKGLAELHQLQYDHRHEEDFERQLCSCIVPKRHYFPAMMAGGMMVAAVFSLLWGCRDALSEWWLPQAVEALPTRPGVKRLYSEADEGKTPCDVVVRSPSGQYLAFSNGAEARVLNCLKGRKLEFRHQSEGDIKAFGFLESQDYLLIATSDSIRKIPLCSQAAAEEMPLPHHADSVCFSQRGDVVYYCAAERAVRMKNISEPELFVDIRVEKNVTDIQLSPDGVILAFRYEDGSMSRYHILHRKFIDKKHFAEVRSSCFSDDGLYFMLTYLNGRVDIFRADSSRLLQSVNTGLEGSCSAFYTTRAYRPHYVACIGSGQPSESPTSVFAVASSRRTQLFFLDRYGNLIEEQELDHGPGFPEPVNCGSLPAVSVHVSAVCFSERGSYLCIGYDNGIVRIVNLATRQEVLRIDCGKEVKYLSLFFDAKKFIADAEVWGTQGLHESSRVNSIEDAPIDFAARRLEAHPADADGTMETHMSPEIF